MHFGVLPTLVNPDNDRIVVIRAIGSRFGADANGGSIQSYEHVARSSRAQQTRQFGGNVTTGIVDRITWETVVGSADCSKSVRHAPPRRMTCDPMACFL